MEVMIHSLSWQMCLQEAPCVFQRSWDLRTVADGCRTESCELSAQHRVLHAEAVLLFLAVKDPAWGVARRKYSSPPREIERPVLAIRDGCPTAHFQRFCDLLLGPRPIDWGPLNCRLLATAGRWGARVMTSVLFSQDQDRKPRLSPRGIL